MKKPLLAALLGLATLIAVCGGATPSTTNTSGGATSAATACAVPVKAKCPDEASELTGAGATFPAPIYTKWVSEYNKLTGIQINYQP
ncbi:MAG: phosphate ABC transporter substrate-binding protein PstS, partial [Candidatus Limnocylindria bacterium]